MKLATIRFQERLVPTIVDAEQGHAWPLESLLGAGHAPASILDLINRFDTFEAPLRAAKRSGGAVDLEKTVLAAPIPRPARNIMCVGKNYREHAREFGRSGFDSSAGSSPDDAPQAPIIFTKAPETVIADGEEIRYPEGVSDNLDYEAELAVVIGKGGRGIARDDAYAHVWGYVIVNDVTARDWQGRHKQWFLGKSFDTFCPMGPWLVTADEIDPENLSVRCWVNDELRQNANTRDLIFDIPSLIETISAGITLQPGDIIATGTPAGVGIGFNPPRYLRRGDRVKIAIDGLGTLNNSVA